MDGPLTNISSRFLVFPIPKIKCSSHKKKKLKIFHFSKMALTILIKFCGFINSQKKCNILKDKFAVLQIDVTGSLSLLEHMITEQMKHTSQSGVPKQSHQYSVAPFSSKASWPHGMWKICMSKVWKLTYTLFSQTLILT